MGLLPVYIVKRAPSTHVHCWVAKVTRQVNQNTLGFPEMALTIIGAPGLGG